jgi:hypothetical protein
MIENMINIPGTITYDGKEIQKNCESFRNGLS